jgi:formiminotetrahydrofolate cyclodeaminase
MAIRTGVKGAILNARVNLADLEDDQFAAITKEECAQMWREVEELESAVLMRVDEVLGA